MAKKYIPIRDAGGGYVAGASVYYECLLCGQSVPSEPPDSFGCRCDNIFIDVSFGRLSIKDGLKAKAYIMDGPETVSPPQV